MRTQVEAIKRSQSKIRDETLAAINALQEELDNRQLQVRQLEDRQSEMRADILAAINALQEELENRQLEDRQEAPAQQPEANCFQPLDRCTIL